MASETNKWPELTLLVKSRPVADSDGNEVPCAFNSRRAEAAELLAREGDAATLREHAERMAAHLDYVLGGMDCVCHLTIEPPCYVCQARAEVSRWRKGPGRDKGSKP